MIVSVVITRCKDGTEVSVLSGPDREELAAWLALNPGYDKVEVYHNITVQETGKRGDSEA